MEKFKGFIFMHDVLHKLWLLRSAFFFKIRMTGEGKNSVGMVLCPMLKSFA